MLIPFIYSLSRVFHIRPSRDSLKNKAPQKNKDQVKDFEKFPQKGDVKESVLNKKESKQNYKQSKGGFNFKKFVGIQDDNVEIIDEISLIGNSSVNNTNLDGLDGKEDI